jgi:SAM-dependent methyltransferase
MHAVTERYDKRDFWIQENLNYAEPHFRLLKVGGLINRMAGTRACELLDVGCGPAALSRVIRPNIRYCGIDIAIHKPALNLREVDFVDRPIAFEGKTFDFVVAQGVFEYIGKMQDQKMSEIASLLRQNGFFITSYVNFDHRDARIYGPYNNVQPLDMFTASLKKYFNIQRALPTSHHIHAHEPNRWYMKKIQMLVNVNIPVLSRRLAVEYLFVCSTR